MQMEPITSVLKKDKVWVGERKNSINDAILYDYDRYTAEEIEALSEGDTIVTHLDHGTPTKFDVNRSKEDYVTINGGIWRRVESTCAKKRTITGL